MHAVGQGHGRGHTCRCMLLGNVMGVGTLADACCWARSWAWACLHMLRVGCGRERWHTCSRAGLGAGKGVGMCLCLAQDWMSKGLQGVVWKVREGNRRDGFIFWHLVNRALRTRCRRHASAAADSHSGFQHRPRRKDP